MAFRRGYSAVNSRAWSTPYTDCTLGSESLLPFAENPPEDSRVEVHAFYSRHLPGRRTLRVYLPLGYHGASPRRYPVLYLQDGQKLFGETAQSWRLQQVLDRELNAEKIAPLLIVGIDHGGGAGERDPSRLEEYTPVADGQFGGGHAENYERMLIDEIMPWIARQYRVRRGREQTGIGGASLGALVSLYVGLKNPKTFGRIAALSPSLWWGGEWIYQFVREMKEITAQKPRIWLDMGVREGSAHMARAEKLRDLLLFVGWKREEQLHFHQDAQGEHHESAWGGRLGEVLRYLFPV